jgi:hypothetical protein
VGLAGGAGPPDHDSDSETTEIANTQVEAAESSPAQTDRETTSATARRWQTSPTSVALVQGKHVVWRFNYGPELNVPFFHPVATSDGHVLTWNRPPDHAWHHGMWFSWKFINGVNYWEHGSQAGKPDGRTDWSHVRVETRRDHSATISMALAYHPAGDQEIVLRERRRIDIFAPEAGGAYLMDWTSTFVAGSHDVVLDRTPPKEQAWGGYAGLSVRFAKDLKQRQLTGLEGLVDFGAGNRYRGRALAMDYSGLVDDKAIGLAFLDHPQNPRSPTPWYAIRGPVMSYLNAALLNDEPLTLDAGEQMTLRYRLGIHSQRWDADRLRAAHTRFRQPTASPETK